MGMKALDDLNAFDESCREVTYKTFLRKVGAEVVARFGFHPPLRSDWHVRYFTGRWRGCSAVCLMHSAIHHIWTIE